MDLLSEVMSVLEKLECRLKETDSFELKHLDFSLSFPFIESCQSFFRHTSTYIYCILEWDRKILSWFKTLSENVLELRVPRLVCNILPRKFLKLGSRFWQPYRFNCTKIRLCTTLKIEDQANVFFHFPLLRLL